MKLMLGNEALAQGAFEAGCKILSAYPGTPSTEIAEYFSHFEGTYSEWAPNEKVALEMAAGASIAGVRSLTAMKQVGLNVAADPLFNMSYVGINAGLVIITADDPGIHSSQTEQDNRLYSIHAKLPLIEPSNAQECLDYIKEAFAISEEFNTPVIIRTTTRLSHSRSIVNTHPKEYIETKPYTKQLEHILSPNLSKIKRVQIEERLKTLTHYSNSTFMNITEINNKSIGIISSGVSFQHSKEIFGENASYLKLGFTFPFPDKKIKDFAESVEKLIVIEENEPFLENAIKSMGISCIGKDKLPSYGELSPEVIRLNILGESIQSQRDEELPIRKPTLCPGCPHRSLYYVTRKYKNVISSGDIGCYSLGGYDPLNALDTIICMGASISAGTGMKQAQMFSNKKYNIFAFIGDSTFFHSGITGLINAVYNNSPIITFILDNSITSMTGFQDNPGSGKVLMGTTANKIHIEKIVISCGVKEENLYIIDPNDLKKTKEVIDDALQKNEPVVIISRRECVLNKKVSRTSYAFIDNNCTNCNKCLSIGCPAILNTNLGIDIDSNTCINCGVCSQICTSNAIKSEVLVYEK